MLTYLQLRVLDEQKRLLDATVAAYERSLRLTQNRYEVGVAAQADVAVRARSWKTRRPNPSTWIGSVGNTSMPSPC